MRRLHVAVPYWLRHTTDNMERSNRPHERKGAGVDVRGKRCANMLIPKSAGHIADGLLLAGSQRRWERQDDVQGKSGASDSPLDVCNWNLRWKSGCRSAYW